MFPISVILEKAFWLYSSELYLENNALKAFSGAFLSCFLASKAP